MNLFNNAISIWKRFNASFENGFVVNWLDASEMDDNLVKFVLLDNFKWKT